MANPKPANASRTSTKSSAPRTPPLPYQAKVPVSATSPGAKAPGPSAPELPESLRAPIPKRIDPSSPAYKAASRKYIGFMVAMPILLVTSYVLFDRLALGHEAKSLHKETETPAKDVV
ncbi:hypothetical protein PFICI_07027 [Pestalotiopsis fici W106-1]|uniref:Uncharacterized protein n=1 Tax=Pestalotiopsis fici (strain W106-1 / CGMCC3.15140) TaxID=1229662 RepID=W3X7J1_PESFW|nr:uncharacterized protein PFICI_07027 [Pestalotiopsis fici W106-1]ETS82025.1 hypothetical protein PFICI_07027 [Pestalotiopsis fici W106-1]